MAKRKRTALKDQKANIFEYYQKNTHRDVNLDDVYEQLKITDKDEQTFARLRTSGRRKTYPNGKRSLRRCCC